MSYYSIPSISKDLEQHINRVLLMDEYVNGQSTYSTASPIYIEGKKSEKYLMEVGIIDSDEQFVEPELLEGEFAILADWLKNNI